jgi:DNA-binding MarR family transcriptional regulator
MGKKSKGKDRVGKKDRQKALGLGAPEPAVVTGSGAAETRAAADVLAEGQTRPAVGATELASRLAGLSTVLQRDLARADTGEGLTRARLSTLGLLVMGGPRTLGELAASEHVRPPTMTRLIHAMEADELVVREPNPNDGRSVVIRATARGEQQLQLGRDRQIAPLARSIAKLGRAERVQLEGATDLLGRLLRTSAWGPADPAE